jgi:hypothetical protein
MKTSMLWYAIPFQVSNHTFTSQGHPTSVLHQYDELVQWFHKYSYSLELRWTFFCNSMFEINDSVNFYTCKINIQLHPATLSSLTSLAINSYWFCYQDILHQWTMLWSSHLNLAQKYQRSKVMLPGFFNSSTGSENNITVSEESVCS